MLPDTWLPTCTVVTACSVPVAPTVSTMSPRVIGEVLHLNFGAAAAYVVRPGARSDGADDQQADDCAFHVTPSQSITAAAAGSTACVVVVVVVVAAPRRRPR